MEFAQRIQQLLEMGKSVTRPCDDYYYHAETDTKLQRCTTYLRAGKPFVMGDAWAGSTKIGTDADQIVRDAFVDGIDSLNSYDYKHISQPAFDELRKDTATLINSLEGQWSVYADRVFLLSLENGVAGEVDLLLVNYDTEEVMIVDMKTIRTPSSMPSKMKKYGQQLNTYRAMAEEMMGGYPVKSLYILPVKVTYPAYGDITSTGYMMPWLEVPVYDASIEVNALWKKEKSMTAKEYFDWSNKTKAETNTDADTADWWNDFLDNAK